MSGPTWFVVESVPAMTLRQFAETNGLELTVTERRVPVGSPIRFFARFRDAEVLEGACLVGVFGNGATPEEAVADYARRISLARLVIDAFKESRRELNVPRLTDGAA